MKMLESTYEFEEDPYGRVNLEDHFKETQFDEKKANMEPQSTSTLSESSSLNIRIEAIKVYEQLQR